VTEAAIVRRFFSSPALKADREIVSRIDDLIEFRGEDMGEIGRRVKCGVGR
jgi:hypothetical protein